MRAINLMIVVIIIGAVLMMAPGCTKQPESPVYVTSTLPEIPVECSAECPAEPRLPDDDIRADVAARDRSAMKRAYRCERHARVTCAARLKVLLPQEGAR
jgi:hypothetical protein